MGLVERIEAALSAADTMAELALSLNEGIEEPRLAAAIKAYVKAARGLDLRLSASPPPSFQNGNVGDGFGKVDASMGNVLNNAMQSPIPELPPAPSEPELNFQTRDGRALGRSALAQEMARTKDKKSHAYKVAMRNLQRYAAAEGKQRRKPKQIAKIVRMAERKREQQAARDLKGPVMVTFLDARTRDKYAPRRGQQPRERERSRVSADLNDSELRGVREHLLAGDERGAQGALEEAFGAALVDRSLEDGSPFQVLHASGLIIEPA